MATAVETVSYSTERDTSPMGGLVRIGVFIIVLVLYGRAARFEFTGWDDVDTVENNDLLRPPTWSSLGVIWQSVEGGLYVPVTYSAWWGVAYVARIPYGAGWPPMLWPWPFHALNIVVHAVTALLVFELLLMLLERWRPKGEGNLILCGLGSLLFALHPLQVESVAWISGAKDLLAGFFSVGTVLLWMTADRGGRWKMARILAAIVCGILAMLSKPVAVMLPVVLLVAEMATGAAVGRRGFLRSVRRLMPLVLAAVIVAGITHAAHEVLQVRGAAASDRPALVADSVTFYLGKLVWPAGLTADYGRTPARALAADWTAVKGVIALGLVAIIGLCWRTSTSSVESRQRMVALGVAWFLIFLLPVSGVATFMFQIHSTVADHYMYLPMVGVAMVFVALLAELPRRWGPGVGCLVCAGLAVLSCVQLPVWRDDLTLFGQMVAVNPDSSGSHSNYGNALARAGMMTLATKEFRTAVGLNPNDVTARTNLARALLQQGDYMGAVEQATAALKAIDDEPAVVREDPSDALIIRGAALAGIGEKAKAAADLRRAHVLEGPPGGAAGAAVTQP